MTHICVGKTTIIGSDNGFSPGRRKAIIWTNAGILSIGPLGTNFSEILIEIYIFSFKKIHLKGKMAAILSRPQCVNWGNFVTFVLWAPVILYDTENQNVNISYSLWFVTYLGVLIQWQPCPYYVIYTACDYIVWNDQLKYRSRHIVNKSDNSRLLSSKND